MQNKEVIVSISLQSKTIKVGTLWLQVKNHKETASFEYDKSWLNYEERFSLEPALTLMPGIFHTGQDKSLFGAIGDSAPDRWGRILMRRQEAALAKEQKRAPRTLSEIDYLVGVSDDARQGALRFSQAPDEQTYLSPNHKKSIPPLVDLPKLLAASEKFIADNESLEDLRLLLLPGSSLGGARPKACIKDKDGSLAIAKFSKFDDDFNVVAWEAVALSLAKNAGINVPRHRLHNIGKKSVLIVTRFDRQQENRIPFLSAMSMLGARDNESHSYLEIAYAIAQHGANPIQDLHELWRRIIFSIMISNTDDHLRNHGFLYQPGQGWQLSPAYDINPTSRENAAHVLTTSIDLYDNTASLDTALRVAPDFRLDQKHAQLIISEVAHAVSIWREVAVSYGLSKRECDRMASAFSWQ